MDSNTSAAPGGGCLIFAGFIIGAVLGIALGQPSLGVIIGVVAGAAIALAQWLLTRSRSR